MSKAPSLRNLAGRLFGPALAGDPAIPAALEDPRSAIAFGNGIIFLGLGLFIAWASFAPLDEGVSATGVVSVESMRKTITHQTGGTVRAIYVSENQFVHAGDVLLTFDREKAQTALDAVAQEFISASAKQARLTAEQTLDENVHFPEDLVKFATDMKRQDILVSQESLFRIRRQTLGNELAILRENQSASQSQVAGIRQQLAARQRQVALLAREIDEGRPLVEEGYLARNKLSEQERQLAELTSTTSDLQARIAREVSSNAEIQLKILQRRKEFLREVETAIPEAQREVANLREKLADARADMARTEIRAPVSGQVQSLQAQTIGAAITPGAKVMEIVPEGEQLLLDVQVPVHLITKVTPGLETDIHTSAFLDTPQLVVEGRVQSVSSDRHEPSPGSSAPPYYLARIQVTQKGLETLHGRQLRPGMPVEVVIKTGERSLLAYILTPITRRVFNAFKEP